MRVEKLHGLAISSTPLVPTFTREATAIPIMVHDAAAIRLTWDTLFSGSSGN